MAYRPGPTDAAEDVTLPVAIASAAAATLPTVVIKCEEEAPPEAALEFTPPSSALFAAAVPPAPLPVMTLATAGVMRPLLAEPDVVARVSPTYTTKPGPPPGGTATANECGALASATSHTDAGAVSM